MKLFFFISFFFICSCRPIVTKNDNGGYVDSSAATAVDEIANLKARMTSAETRIYIAEKDSIWQAKQILALQKQVLDLMVTYVNPFKQKFISHDKDTVWQAKQILDLQKKDLDYMVTYLIPYKNRLYAGEKDSMYQAKQIDSLKRQFSFKLTSPLSTAITNNNSNDARQWIDINKLKAASPVTQIPIMQSQIKTLQSSSANMNTQITTVSRSLYDTAMALRKLVTFMAVVPDSSEYSIINSILRFKPLPTILKDISDAKKDIKVLQLQNTIPPTIK